MSTPQIVDDKDLNDAGTEINFNEIDDLAKPNADTEVKPTEPVVAPTEEEVPEKYKGKTIAQVIEMHQNAERMAGKQSQEVGDLRNVVDKFINKQSESTPTEVEEINVLDDPKGAVNQIIENHPDIIAAKAGNIKREESDALNALLVKHPDANTLIAEPEFVTWVQGSNYRINQFRAAHEKSDVDACDDLFTEYRLAHPAKAATPATDDPKPNDTTTPDTTVQSGKAAAKAASTGAIVPAGGDGKKIYRRVDLVRLNVENPERYAELSDEITLAYTENRVR